MEPAIAEQGQVVGGAAGEEQRLWAGGDGRRWREVPKLGEGVGQKQNREETGEVKQGQIGERPQGCEGERQRVQKRGGSRQQLTDCHHLIFNSKMRDFPPHIKWRKKTFIIDYFSQHAYFA